jgi:hypothetical protein
MTLLFISYICDICNPPTQVRVANQIANKSPTMLSFAEAKQWMLDNPGKYVKHSPDYIGDFSENFRWFSCQGKFFFRKEEDSNESFISDKFLRNDSPDTFVIVE